jgi:hypothetical protein
MMLRSKPTIVARKARFRLLLLRLAHLNVLARVSVS